MRSTLIGINEKLPRWVDAGFTDYCDRLRKPFSLRAVDLPLAVRSHGDIARAKQDEAGRIRAACPKDFVLIALDERGAQPDSIALSQLVEQWQRRGRDLVLAVGGPDGLAPDLLNEATFVWSLSSLTLPHALVRIFVAEQLFRVQCLLSGHPYHRA